MARVLVVDDDPGTLETFHLLLRQTGHEVLTAECGGRGLEILSACACDLLLTDLRLPDMTGLDVVRQLRASGVPIPCVVMTGYGSIRSAVEAMRLGVSDYLEKPLDDAALYQAVGRALSQSGTCGPAGGAATADGMRRWATAVASVLECPQDPKNLLGWSRIRGVAPETLRGWCRTVGLNPKASLDLARVLRAASLARGQGCAPECFLDAADFRTLKRLMVAGGVPAGTPVPPLDQLLDRQTFVTDATALAELRRAVAEP